MTIKITHEGKCCLDCALMISNGECDPDMSLTEEERIAKATVGWTLNSNESDGDFSTTRPCVTCGSTCYGDRYNAVKLEVVK